MHNKLPKVLNKNVDYKQNETWVESQEPKSHLFNAHFKTHSF